MKSKFFQLEGGNANGNNNSQQPSLPNESPVENTPYSNQPDFSHHALFDLDMGQFDAINHNIKLAPLSTRLYKVMPEAAVLSIAFFFISYLVNKTMSYAVDNSEDMPDPSIAIALLCFTALFITGTNRIKNQTGFYTQNTNPKALKISEALLTLSNLYPELYNAWCKKIKRENHKEIIQYIQETFKKGICFGYTIAAIEALGKHPSATGKELREELNYQTVLEKMILHIMCEDFQEEDIPSDCIIISSVQSEDLKAALRLSYSTEHTDYINNYSNNIDIKNTPADELMRQFYTQLSFPAFIDIPNYTTNFFSNSLRADCCSDELVLSEEEKKHIEKLKAHSSSNENEASEIPRLSASRLRIYFYKETLKLSKRKKEYIHNHLVKMSANTILAGDIRVLFDSSSHSIMFRHSNGLYYFMDANTGSHEFESSPAFFKGLRDHILRYYDPISKDNLTINFIIHALNTKNQIYTFQKENDVQQIATVLN